MLPAFGSWNRGVSRARAGAPTAKVSKLAVTDLVDEDHVLLDFAFAAPGYARAIGRGRMLIFQPGFLSRETWVPPEDDHRQSSVSFKSESVHEQLKVDLPEGYVADELPPPVEIETPFVSYRCESILRNSMLIYERSLVWRPEVNLPASDYEDLRAFYRNMVKAESAPVVLIKL